MPFYTYRQNNSGGSFHINNDVTVNVIVEASDPVEANSIAEEKGLYFNGVEDGIDCYCCGDRWYPMWEKEKGDDKPAIYEQTVEKYLEDEQYLWSAKGEPEVIVYYKDGSKKVYLHE